MHSTTGFRIKNYIRGRWAKNSMWGMKIKKSINIVEEQAICEHERWRHENQIGWL